MPRAKSSAGEIGASPRFATTRWSVVLAAKGSRRDEDARGALSALCTTYWYPLYAFVRRSGHDADAAQDLTQEFFLRCMEKDYLQDVSREKGRFRSFLLAALKHFLSDQLDKARAIKRGGGKTLFSLDAMKSAEERYSMEPSGGATPEQIFERRWALTVLEEVLAQLRREYVRAGKEKIFEQLKGCLSGESGGSHAQNAQELQMSEAAVRVAVHRMRKRYAEMLEAQIADTLDAGGDVEAELNLLFEALG